MNHRGIVDESAWDELGKKSVREFQILVAEMTKTDGTSVTVKDWSRDGDIYRLEILGDVPYELHFRFDGKTAVFIAKATSYSREDARGFISQLTLNLKEKETREAQRKAKGRQQTIVTEINGLGVRQREQIALVAKSLEEGLGLIRADIENCRQTQTELRRAQEPLRQKLGPVLSNRAEAEADFLHQLRLASNAIAEYSRFKSNTLTRAAKLINDEIVAKDLKVDLVSGNGEVQNSPKTPTGEAIDNDLAGVLALTTLRYNGTVFANVSGKGPKITGLVRGERVFFNFPAQISDKEIRQAFLQLYDSFVARVQLEFKDEAAWDGEPSVLVSTQQNIFQRSRKALEKFDYKNGAEVEGYRENLTRHTRELQALRNNVEGLSWNNEKISRKEAVLASPREQLGAALREEIKLTACERRQELEEELATFEFGHDLSDPNKPISFFDLLSKP